MAADPDQVMAPAPGDEARLWSLLETAWARLGPEVRQARQALVVRPTGSPADTAVLKGALPGFLDALGRLCEGLPADELIALDRVVERKLWEIDRSDVRAVIGGSDDGFLYARGFTVAMGREFHGCVAGDPRMGAPWAECEEMCYLFAHLHHERFGAFPGTGSASPASPARTWPAGWTSCPAALSHRSRNRRSACPVAARPSSERARRSGLSASAISGNAGAFILLRLGSCASGG